VPASTGTGGAPVYTSAAAGRNIGMAPTVIRRPAVIQTEAACGPPAPAPATSESPVESRRLPPFARFVGHRSSSRRRSPSSSCSRPISGNRAEIAAVERDRLRDAPPRRLALSTICRRSVAERCDQATVRRSGKRPRDVAFTWRGARGIRVVGLGAQHACTTIVGKARRRGCALTATVGTSGGAAFAPAPAS
jgi:hypothetical protein